MMFNKDEAQNGTIVLLKLARLLDQKPVNSMTYIELRPTDV